MFVPLFDLCSSPHRQRKQSASREQTVEQLSSGHWHRLPLGVCPSTANRHPLLHLQDCRLLINTISSNTPKGHSGRTWFSTCRTGSEVCGKFLETIMIFTACTTTVSHCLWWHPLTLCDLQPWFVKSHRRLSPGLHADEFTWTLCISAGRSRYSGTA